MGPYPDSPGFAGVRIGWPAILHVRDRRRGGLESVRPWAVGGGEGHRVGEVARSSAALAWRWSGRVRAFPRVLRRVSGRSSRAEVPLGQSGPAPGFSGRWQTLLSRNTSQIRRPAQHKNGFLSSEERNPVERAHSRNQSPRGRAGGTGEGATCLHGWREQQAPARANGPRAGKVLRKVSTEPPRVNLSKRLLRDVKPRGADSRSRFRTCEGARGLTLRLRSF